MADICEGKKTISVMYTLTVHNHAAQLRAKIAEAYKFALRLT